MKNLDNITNPFIYFLLQHTPHNLDSLSAILEIPVCKLQNTRLLSLEDERKLKKFATLLSPNRRLGEFISNNS